MDKPGRIHLSPPHITGSELPVLSQMLADGWAAPAGPYIQQFEAALCAATGSPYAVALSSGTAALHLALLAVGVQPGQVVLLPSLTFAGGANPVRYIGAEPVFVDSEPDTWNLSPHWLTIALRDCQEKGLSVGAVIATHLYGRIADMAPIAVLCQQYNVPLIEDAAEAIGASWQGKGIGHWGQATILSFNGNKTITTAGGGALLTPDAALADHARFLATQAKDTAPHYQHSQLGYNYRMNGLAAAFGIGQLSQLPLFLARRKEIYQTYYRHLHGLKGLSFLPERPDAHDSHWLTVLAVDPEAAPIHRDGLIELLASFEVESRPVWKPMHLQPLYHDRPFYGGTVAETAFANGICLPSGSNLTGAQQTRVINLVMSAWGCRM